MNLTLSALVILILSTPAQAVPQCMNDQQQMVDCYSQEKIQTAYRLLKGKYDWDYIVSIEINRGKFANAMALADWIERGDTK